MASFEEQMDMLENVLTRISKVQEQGQARLEQALKQVEELIPAAGEAVANAMKDSTDEAAKAHRDALLRVVDEVATASRKTAGDAAKAAQRSEDLLGKVDAASHRMVTSEQKVEASLDALLPKVVRVREGLEKELGDVVNVTATTEEEIKKMVAAIRTSMTKEIEGEIRKKLHEAAGDAAHRIYNLGEWWGQFTRVGIPMAMLFFAVVSGGLGWWFGQHQMKGEAREEALKDVADNVTARPLVYQVLKTSDGKARVEETKGGLTVPLVVLEEGGIAPMKRGRDGKWYWGEFHWESTQVPIVRVWDGKTRQVLKDVNPE